jgi:peroxin-10
MIIFCCHHCPTRHQMTNAADAWAFASSSQLLQSWTEDTRYIAHLGTLLPSTPFNALLAPCIYYMLTKMNGKTLGEEHAGIRQVDILNNALPSKLRILIYITATILSPKIMSRIGDYRLKIALIALQAGHIALFYWNGQYIEWIKRCLGLRYICDPRQAPFERTRNHLHSILVGITFAKAALEIFTILSSNSQKQVILEIKDATVLKWGQCALCLQDIKHASGTKCGHIYCWYCIVEWLEMQSWCPLCRQTCHPQQLLRLP